VTTVAPVRPQAGWERPATNAPRRFDMLRQLVSNRRVVAGLVIIVPIVLLAVLFGVLPFRSPNASSLSDRMVPPSLTFPFGTDTLGRDQLSRTIVGARISILVGVMVATISIGLGMLIGTVAGYFGGRIDSVISAVLNVFLSFPGLLIGLLLVAVLGPGVWQIIAAISIAFTPRAARIQRASVLGIRNHAYMDAARQVAAPSRWILARHVVPNTLSPMLVLGSIFTADAILIEATISFTGIGIVPPTATWGSIIRGGQPVLREAWWIALIPAMCLILFAIGLHLVADGARQVIDPTEHGGRR
jgi:peptide/nickel transport system permease protein